jgi:ABC-2 type transport system ATP-binding protein
MSTISSTPLELRVVSSVNDEAIAVSIRGLSKRYPVQRSWKEILRAPLQRDHVTVVDDIRLDIRRGEFFALLGPNGAGKSTLFKMLSTLIIPDTGTALIEGFDIHRDGRRVRGVLAPVIPEERSLNWRLSARENLTVFAALYGYRGDALRRRVGELLDLVGLADTGHKMVGRFSSGMRQRLLIARTLLGHPRVLLLDEPTRSLDPVSARQFRHFLRSELAASYGCTVLLATHNTEEALELCDRVGVLHRGRLLAVGAAEELARDTGDNRYRMLAASPVGALLDALVARGTITSYTTLEPDAEGWVPVQVEIPGGHAQAAAVVAAFGEADVPLALFERVPSTLADLIERIVAQNSTPAER